MSGRKRKIEEEAGDDVSEDEDEMDHRDTVSKVRNLLFTTIPFLISHDFLEGWLQC